MLQISFLDVGVRPRKRRRITNKLDEFFRKLQKRTFIVARNSGIVILRIVSVSWMSCDGCPSQVQKRIKHIFIIILFRYSLVFIFFRIFTSSCFQLGPDGLSVPVSLHATNRARLCERLKNKKVQSGAIVLLQGGDEKCRDDTDAEIVFRQVLVDPS